MLIFQSHLPNLRLVFFTLLFAMPSCQSSGQKKQDDSDWSGRRKIPDSVLAELPSMPDSLAHTTHFQFFKYGKTDSIAIENIMKNSEVVATKIEAFTGKRLTAQPIQWYFYPSCEMKGLILKNSSPCQVDFEKKEIHYVVNDVFNDHYSGQENELILSNLLGAPKIYALQAGLAIYFSKKWQKMGYQYWAGKLLAANQLPSLEDLLNDQNWEHSSNLIYESAAASFCAFLINHYGRNSFLGNYQNWDFSIAEIDSLEPAWREQCNAPAELQSTIPPNPLPYLKGFNFAHEGYRIYNGYGSRKAEQSLQHLNSMGANAVAIIPYSFTRYPKKPNPIPVAKRAGSENDESVIQTSEDAQALGLSVVLKPQIWVGRGMWTGDIEMGSEEDWELFFKQYGHWISHYAIMAEIYGWEMLCLGTELVQTTLKREKDWRGLIRSVRTLYSGNLTYAANWGDEFENIAIWDELDYIGLNCYYPLSHKENASDRELTKGFDNVIGKIEKVYNRYKKPILFTEIGFPCIEAAWKEPHNDWGDFVPNSDHQRRCYEIVFNGIKGKPWCAGILWWKYPSDLEHSHRRNTGFTPHGGAAENVVAKWFQQL